MTQVSDIILLMVHYFVLSKAWVSSTCELMMRIVVLFPTSRSYPSVGAALNRKTASWASERQTMNQVNNETKRVMNGPWGHICYNDDVETNMNSKKKWCFLIPIEMAEPNYRKLFFEGLCPLCWVFYFPFLFPFHQNNRAKVSLNTIMWRRKKNTTIFQF